MQTNRLPLVSIALCTYNGEKYLTEQMETIILQDYNNLEIIVVDDCSTDNTLTILQKFAKRDNRIKLYRNETNIGCTKNFEKAIALCTGKYIALADQDDIWVKNKIRKMVRAIDGHILVYHDSDFIDGDGKRIGTETMGSRVRMYEGESCLPFILSNCISGHATLFDRELINYILPFDPRFYHDWWMAYVAFNIGKVKYINKVYVHYRQHPDSMTDILELEGAEPTAVKQPTGRVKRLPLNLNWLKYCTNFRHNRDPRPVNEAYNLFSKLVEGKEKGRSFLYLLRNFDLLFYIGVKPKNFFSKLNLVRKIYF